MSKIYDPKKLQFATKYRNDALDEKELSFNDLINTVLALFTTIFSGLVFLGTTKIINSIEQIFFYILSSVFALIIVSLSLTTKLLRFYLKNKILEDATHKLKTYPFEENAPPILYTDPPKLTAKILFYIPWIIYLSIIIDFILLFCFSLSLLFNRTN